MYYSFISWDGVFQLLVEELWGLVLLDEVVFYILGCISNEVVFMYQLFVCIFGINNLFDCLNMCYEFSGVGLS